MHILKQISLAVLVATIPLAASAPASAKNAQDVIIPGTPMADVTKSGDSFYTNEFGDNVLVSSNGFCDKAAAFCDHDQFA